MTDTPTLRPIESLKEAMEHMSPWTSVVRRIRPQFPDAIVYMVDAGDDSKLSCLMMADTRDVEHGDITVVVAKEWLKAQPELKSAFEEPAQAQA